MAHCSVLLSLSPPPSLPPSLIPPSVSDENKSSFFTSLPPSLAPLSLPFLLHYFCGCV